ncbi:MAG: lamin tail domain-containing protein [Anaerolineae bacterium]
MINKRKPTRFFWSVLIALLLFSFGQIITTSASNNASRLIINEFLAANGRGLADEDGDLSDWIEIYNPGRQTVNLAGWALTNDPNQPQQWTFPDMNLRGGEYLVVFASGKNRRTLEPGAALHTNFKLSKSGDFLGLHNVLEGRFVDVISPGFPEQFGDISYGRYGDASTYGYLFRPTPGGANDETLVWAGVVAPVEVSVERGYYEQPVAVALTSATPESTIRYTTDGSQPTEINGAVYRAPLTVKSTTLLRAVALKPDHLPSETATHSYIFVDGVLSQPANPPGLPSSWGARLTNIEGRTVVSPVEADYGLDPDLVDEPGEREVIAQGLAALPALSLVMDGQSFAGLYTYPGERGKASERPVSVELIDPAGAEPGFQVNAGLRLDGDLQDPALSPRRSLRLFFRGDYGASRLEYPLFADSPVERFDTLLLQAGAGRDQWLRASQAAMSGLGSHGRFVHLYINGLYWGLYNLLEKPNAPFMATYLGGEEDDWFVADREGPLRDDLDSRADRLNYLFATLGFAARTDGTFEPPPHLAERYAELASYFDPVQLSDYMILDWYATTLGWPENDWYAAIRLQDRPGQGKSLIDEAPPAGERAADPQLNIVYPVFETLLHDPDFRMQLADRLYKHLFNEGALTAAKAQARWLALSQALDPAMAGEAARWGDVTPDGWRQSSQAVLARMEGNAASVIAVARDAGYYPDLEPPLFSQDGGLVERGFVLTMSAPAAFEGTIYYTTDGSDPRMPVTGAVAPTARAYDGPVVLTATTRLKARAFDDGSGRELAAAGQVPAASPPPEGGGHVWSALHETNFSVVEQDNHLRLTEIMYNPAGGDDYEFLELTNVGNEPLELANLFLDDGVRFTFPASAPALPPGAFVILVSNPAAFAERYPGLAISGAYEGHLSNKGEKITLKDGEGQTLIEVRYDDENGWPISADGRGDSLVLVGPARDPANPQSWRASTHLNGSPGKYER